MLSTKAEYPSSFVEAGTLTPLPSIAVFNALFAFCNLSISLAILIIKY